jgi:hypothetical protein
MNRKLTGALVGAMLTTLLLAAPAAAAVPGNDLPGGAIALPDTFPQSISQDTTEATVSSDDLGCGAGGLDQASVWYTLSPASSVELLVIADASSYLVGINVFAVAPTNDNLIACFGGSSQLALEGGVTYYFMFADVDGEAPNGGQLDVSIEIAPPPIEIELTVDPTGRVTRSGEATITGTATCSAEASLDVGGSIQQSVGRFSIHGSGFAHMSCGPEPTTWSVPMVGMNGRLGNGRATVAIFAFACGANSCSEVAIEATVRLGR